jgi:hypothetical protein
MGNNGGSAVKTRLAIPALFAVVETVALMLAHPGDGYNGQAGEVVFMRFSAFPQRGKVFLER